ncbi:MAG: glutathione S-transferase family protein [Gammaproteobacteria bacterium]
MNDFELIIGNKAYSSWSFRAWLALKHTGVPFTEIRLAMDTPEFKPTVRKYSPTGKVPLLKHGSLAIWDSLAICEYLAEKFPTAKLWPEDATARALARSASAEMHSGFMTIRKQLPFNCRASGRQVAMSPELEAEIARVLEIWRGCRERYGQGGAWLFGRFSIADAMYIPVALRFVTYGIKLDHTAQAYVIATQAHPAVQDWIAAAKQEEEVIETSEVGR